MAAKKKTTSARRVSKATKAPKKVKVLRRKALPKVRKAKTTKSAKAPARRIARKPAARRLTSRAR